MGGKYNIPWTDYIDDYDRIRDAISAVLPAFADYNLRIRQPGGFRLPVPSSERVWKTPSGRAQFRVAAGLESAAEAGVLTLTTVRSHDQYNTTIYGFDDRYRGVFGRRDVIFLHEADMAEGGLKTGDLVDVMALTGAVLKGFHAVAHDIARGCAAAYYPEANVLLPLASHDPRSGTPSYKAIAVRVVKPA